MVLGRLGLWDGHYRWLFLLAALLISTTLGCQTHSYQKEARSKLHATIRGHTDSEIFASVTKLPVAIRRLLGPIADSGEPFDPTCVGVEGAPHRRFLTAIRIGPVYTVAVEHGGVAYYWNATEFLQAPSGTVISSREVDY